jgi:phospholipid transport system substrate-binding protein
MNRFAIALCLGLGLGVAPAVALAAPDSAAQGKTGPATEVVRHANDTISTLLKQKPAAGSPQEKELAAKVTSSVRDFLDIDELGKRAMTDQWAKLSKEQQTDFLEALRQLIEANYVKGLRSNLDYAVAYTGESTDSAGNTVVHTQIKTKNKGRPVEIRVDYVVVKEGDKLRAFDVITDDVGLVDNYRTTFNKIMEKDGFTGLMSRIKKKQAEVNGG